MLKGAQTRRKQVSLLGNPKCFLFIVVLQAVLIKIQNAVHFGETKIHALRSGSCEPCQRESSFGYKTGSKPHLLI